MANKNVNRVMINTIKTVVDMVQHLTGCIEDIVQEDDCDSLEYVDKMRHLLIRIDGQMSLLSDVAYIVEEEEEVCNCGCDDCTDCNDLDADV